MRTLRKICYFIILLLSSAVSEALAQTPEWLWVRSSNGNYAERGMSVVTDKNGNAYASGYSQSSLITFDTTSLSFPDTTCSFFVKYDPSGNLLWATTMGKGARTDVYGLAVDKEDNIYVTGCFDGTSLIFGTDTLRNISKTPSGKNWYGMFVAKYDPDGNVQWAHTAHASHYSQAFDITISEQGNIFITGSFFSDSLDFGTGSLKGTNAIYTSDVFTVKYNENGEVVWARSIGGGGSDLGKSIAVDEHENVYIGGNFIAPMHFGSDSLIGSPEYYEQDLFIAKYNSLGEELWARSYGGHRYDELQDLVQDSQGNIYAVGMYSDTISFGSHTLLPYGEESIFVVKSDSLGVIQWANSAGGGYSSGKSITLDKTGNVYITGYITGTATFGDIPLPATGTGDIFVAKYSNGGAIVWAKSAIGISNSEVGFGISCDSTGYIYLTGNYSSDSVHFDSHTLVNPTNTHHMFIAKLDTMSSSTYVTEENGRTTFHVFPHPVQSLLNISIPEVGDWSIYIYNIDGQLVYQSAITSETSMIDLSTKPKGTYIYQLFKNDEIKKTEKFILE